jgi:ZIP family zinc transporter
MVFVVAEEVVPESQSNGNRDFTTMGAVIGFTVVMIIGAAFGS